MNKEQFSTHWQEIKRHIIERWDRLTDEDVRQIGGRYDQFVAKIQEKYSLSKEEIDDEFRNWAPHLSFDKETTSDKHVRDIDVDDKEKESTLGKWLLAAGIPLLLLLGYLTLYDTPNTKDTTPSTTSVQANPDLNTTRDGLISQNIRKTLLANTQLASNLKNVTVDASSGVVTLSGTVKSEEEKALATRIAEKVSGVVDVKNNLDVRP
ncbi:MAG: BON domain-containing protein [Parachlamydiaceae bacterium]|nr:BON domain-containing protein [Parachlamydiaceae bacterium]